jgi:uncharacterized protein (DUF849 family)
MLLKAAINGARSKHEHAAVPVTSLELASVVVECVNAGAAAIHFHARSSDGSETLDASLLASNLEAIRAKTPAFQSV